MPASIGIILLSQPLLISFCYVSLLICQMNSFCNLLYHTNLPLLHGFHLQEMFHMFVCLSSNIFLFLLDLYIYLVHSVLSYLPSLFSTFPWTICHLHNAITFYFIYFIITSKLLNTISLLMHECWTGILTCWAQYYSKQNTVNLSNNLYKIGWSCVKVVQHFFAP